MEDNNCPKEGCGRPESTHRFRAGKRLSICGNGHSWDAIEVVAQRQKAEAAKRRESAPGGEVRSKINPGIDYERIRRHFENKPIFEP